MNHRRSSHGKSPPRDDRRHRPPTHNDEFASPFDDETWDVFLPEDDLEPMPEWGDLWWDQPPDDER